MKGILEVNQILVVILSVDIVICEYTCLCNYNVELNVYQQSSVDSQQVGYMYEFDCKPLVKDIKVPGWFVIAYQNQMGFVEDAPNTDVQLCVGSIPKQDMLTTTPSTSTLTTTSTTTTDVTSSTLPTTTTDMTSSTLPTTTTGMTSYSIPTTTTEMTSTSIPTTTKGITSSTIPTTTTEMTSSSIPTSTTGMTSSSIPTKITEMTELFASTTTDEKTSSTESITTTQMASSTLPTTITRVTPSTTQTDTTIKQATSSTPQRTPTEITQSSTTSQMTSPPTSSTTSNMTTHTTPATMISTHSLPTSTGQKSTTIFTTVPSTSGTTTPVTTMTEGTEMCPLNVMVSSKINGTTIVRSDNVCYEVSQNLTSWAYAEKYCKQNDGHLIHIASKNEQDFIYNYLASIKSHTVWIGLYRLYNESNFKWISGDPVTYTNWMQNRPPSSRIVNCVYITPSGEWKDTNCDMTGYHHGFVCQYGSSIMSPSTVTPSSIITPIVSTSSETTPKPLHGTDLCPNEVIDSSRRSGTTLAQYGNYCYEVSQSLTWWLKAETQCIQNGGHLAYIVNKNEQDFIFNYLASINSHTVWIGLHDRNNEAKFEWTSGKPVTYTNWVPHHSTHNTAWDCTYISGSGDWKDTLCNTTGYHHGYICQYDISHKTADDGDTDLCPEYVRHIVNQENSTLGYFNGSCWALVSTPMTWPHADGVCHSRYGDLATITSPEEQNFIFNFLSRYTNRTRAWIGLNDINNEGHFRWSSGSHSQYTNWDPNHSGNQRGENDEDCVTMNLSLNGVWDDIPCGNFAGNTDHGWKCPSLCQYKASSVG